MQQIAIVGCGVAGLAAANFLQQLGHELTIFERAPELRPVGAGLLLQPTGLGVLRQLGMESLILSLGHKIDALIGHNERRKRVLEMVYSDLKPELFGLGIQRGALFQTLLDGVAKTVQIKTATDIETVDAKTGRLSDAQQNSYGPFDLVILADGAASQLRGSVQSLLKHDQLYPWGAVWALVADPQQQFHTVLWQRYRRARQMCGLLPVGRLPGESTSAHRLCVYWSLSRTDLERFGEHSMPAWKQEVRALWPELHDLVAELPFSAMAKASYRDVVQRDYCLDRVVMLGDHAHAMSPQLGQGGNMALLDAMTLSQEFERQPRLDLALAEYSARRKKHVAIYQHMSRHLTPFFQSNSVIGAWLRDTFLLPVSKLPIISKSQLKILAGTQQGMMGTWSE